MGVSEVLAWRVEAVLAVKGFSLVVAEGVAERTDWIGEVDIFRYSYQWNGGLEID